MNLFRILISKKILNHANYIFINVNDETQKKIENNIYKISAKLLIYANYDN